ncbi:MAG TPA: DUF6084 family protein [Pirellulales bacterium]|jgi:hypothetical protein|nr:DUF6084 family protein [Pirellulales bacterium]
MPELAFQVELAEAVAYAAVPQIAFKLRITQTGEHHSAIQAIALRCQIRIEPTKRRYNATAHRKLRDLFGTPDRWSQTLRSMLWLHTSAMVPAFSASVVVDLPAPCSFDFNLAATKYFDALDDGEIPLSLLFSGTVFYESDDGSLQVMQLSWDKEATFRLPVQIWRTMMDHYYPNAAWLCLRRDVLEELADYKRRHSLPTWEHALEQLLAGQSDGAVQSGKVDSTAAISAEACP